ncbi:hypothetical protein WR25_15951 [Diploscapter pachys]|uniref:Uncharacterized protein n=1 Tax=Diploscapter pachys TaxID=2018661 RepID=A0A2A2LBE2_9BILA|nr:hypothetical protein WR25_15951 [Diploscapter pachys]
MDFVKIENFQEVIRTADPESVKIGPNQESSGNSKNQQQIVNKPGDGVAVIYRVICEELSILRGYIRKAGGRMRTYFKEKLVQDFRRLVTGLFLWIARRPQKSLGQISLSGEDALLLCGEIPLIPQNRAPKYTLNELREVLLKNEDVEDGVFHRYLSDVSRWEKIPVRKQNSTATLSINDFQLFNKPISRGANTIDDLDSDFESRSLLSPSTQVTERDNRVASLEAQLEKLTAQMTALIKLQKDTVVSQKTPTRGKRMSFDGSVNTTLISSEDEGKGVSSPHSPNASQKNFPIAPISNVPPPAPPPPPLSIFTKQAESGQSPGKVAASKKTASEPSVNKKADKGKQENIPPTAEDDSPFAFLKDIKRGRFNLKKVSRSPGGTPSASIRRKNKKSSSNRSFLENALQKKFASVNISEQEEDTNSPEDEELATWSDEDN